MLDYWIIAFQTRDGNWFISCHDCRNMDTAVDYAAARGDDLGKCNARVFHCQIDPNADILTVAQQLVWEKKGDVQRFINQRTLNAS